MTGWLDIATKKRIEVLDSVIIKAIEAYAGKPKNEWLAIANLVDFNVPPKYIKQAIDEAVSEGLIERQKLTSIQNSLTTLGFKPVEFDGKIVYQLKV